VSVKKGWEVMEGIYYREKEKVGKNKTIIIREMGNERSQKSIEPYGGKQNGGRIKFSFKWKNNEMGCSRFG